MMQILNHTPIWVFGLLALLVRLGLQQSNLRTVTLQRFAILPVAMLGLSAYGVWSTFNGSTLAMTCWIAGTAVAAITSQQVNFARGVQYGQASRTIQLPGSWLPLVLMMGIFFTKYLVGVMLAMHADLKSVDIFVATVSLISGLWSGVFVGRAAKILLAIGSNPTATVTQMS